MQPAKFQPFGLTLALSFLIPVPGYFLDQALRWTDTQHGLFNGVIFTIMHAFGWVFWFLPWCLVVAYIFRRKQWPRFRTHVALAPSIAVLLLTLITLVVQPPTPAGRLRGHGATLPADASGLRYFFSGGGVADYADTYFFSCSPTATNRLITELNLQRLDDSEMADAYLDFSEVQGAPDYKTWQNASLYYREDDGWTYRLLTNADRSMVYIQIYCI